jgi:hypothetical protein
MRRRSEKRRVTTWILIRRRERRRSSSYSQPFPICIFSDEQGFRKRPYRSVLRLLRAPRYSSPRSWTSPSVSPPSSVYIYIMMQKSLIRQQNHLRRPCLCNLPPRSHPHPRRPRHPPKPHKRQHPILNPQRDQSPRRRKRAIRFHARPILQARDKRRPDPLRDS